MSVVEQEFPGNVSCPNHHPVDLHIFPTTDELLECQCAVLYHPADNTSICQPCYSKHNWRSMPYWKVWGTFFTFPIMYGMVVTKGTKPMTASQSTIFRQHSNFGDPTSVFPFTNLFKVVHEMICSIFSFQNSLLELGKKAYIVPASGTWVILYCQWTQQAASEQK